ncbi:hypothetical protein EBB06_00280 [Crenobacter cavernae]|uniref:Uncharacterized protein n=1 Tax=Crenobacter cavernae TaxID=2290923 RepID=A0ABY0FGJ0_9NEIS|nr:hypothetical protein EBB06_00280 [Crenobacter cavernae]
MLAASRRTAVLPCPNPPVAQGACVLLPSEIEGLFREDAPYQDLTCRLLGVRRQSAHLTVVARDGGVASGVEAALDLFAYLGVRAEARVDEGDALLPGATLLTASGPASALHLAARQALNLIERFSGIASKTRELVECAQRVNPELVVALPRQGFPGTRRLTAQAVLAGGGQALRLGLSESIEIGREHWQFVGGIEGLMPRIARLKRAAGGKPITLIAGSGSEALRLARAEPDFLELPAIALPSLAELCKSVHRLSPRTRLACCVPSGDADWARYAACGLDWLIVPDLMQAPALPVSASWSVAQPLSLGLGVADSLMPVDTGASLFSFPAVSCADDLPLLHSLAR